MRYPSIIVEILENSTVDQGRATAATKPNFIADIQWLWWYFFKTTCRFENAQRMQKVLHRALPERPCHPELAIISTMQVLKGRLLNRHVDHWWSKVASRICICIYILGNLCPNDQANLHGVMPNQLFGDTCHLKTENKSYLNIFQRIVLVGGIHAKSVSLQPSLYIKGFVFSPLFQHIYT